jgi:polyribonucleotide nucleotidyltransferase
VEDVVQVGDEIQVMVMEIDNLGRINLSRRAVLEGTSPEELEEPAPGEIPSPLTRRSSMLTTMRPPQRAPRQDGGGGGGFRRGGRGRGGSGGSGGGRPPGGGPNGGGSRRPPAPRG